jgi:hypothetical protein
MSNTIALWNGCTWGLHACTKWAFGKNNNYPPQLCHSSYKAMLLSKLCLLSNIKIHFTILILSLTSFIWLDQSGLGCNSLILCLGCDVLICCFCYFTWSWRALAFRWLNRFVLLTSKCMQNMYGHWFYDRYLTPKGQRSFFSPQISHF